MIKKYLFPERLKELRLERGLSQYQLASELNNQITHTAIAHWENKERIPNLQAVMMLADYFGVTIDYLAGLED